MNVPIDYRPPLDAEHNATVATYADLGQAEMAVRTLEHERDAEQDALPDAIRFATSFEPDAPGRYAPVQ